MEPGWLELNLHTFEKLLNPVPSSLCSILFKISTMNKIVFSLLFLPLLSIAQKVPMRADRWEFTPGKVNFQEVGGVPAIKILTRREQAVLKEVNFSNGTI